MRPWEFDRVNLAEWTELTEARGLYEQYFREERERLRKATAPSAETEASAGPVRSRTIR